MAAFDLDPNANKVVHPRAGVKIGGPDALKKRLEYAVLLGGMVIGSLLAVGWMICRSVTWIEWTALGVGVFLINIGAGLGYHRYFTHRAFETSEPMRYVLGVLAQWACQGSLLKWVADHRRHHAHADRCGDVHRPTIDGMCNSTGKISGLLTSHFGWLFDPTTSDLDVFGRDLQRDPVVMYCHRTRWFWAFVSLVAAPFAFGYGCGGWEHAIGAMLVGGFLRTFLFLNCVLGVNSIGHTFGTERFEQQHHAKNNWLMAIITFGEGWHNNHHRHPRSAYHGLAWYEIDVNGSIIGALEKLGLVWGVVRAPELEGAATPDAPRRSGRPG